MTYVNRAVIKATAPLALLYFIVQVLLLLARL